jgi:phosphatidylinositol glycan class B
VRRGSAFYWCVLAIAVAAILRAWLSWFDHGVFWPDEIHQSLEQAHRAVFGYGLVPWEFRDGARSWFFPGTVAALWEAASLFGVEASLTLVMLARLFMVACSVVAIVFATKLAAEARGMRAGAAVAVILATLPPAVVFSYRGMSETASAPLIALGAWLLSKRSPRAAQLAGLAFGTACLCRYQNGLFVLVFVATLLLQRRWREVASFCAAGAGVALFGGLLDWATWGRPFHSFLTYVEFNLLQDGASTFGVEPFTYYAATLWTSVGPLLLVLIACFCVGALYEPVLGGAVLAYVLAHSVLPHKEFRFLVPCLPLFATVMGIGIDAVLRRVKVPRLALGLSVASALALTASFCFSLLHLDFAHMGQYAGTERASASIWRHEQEPTLLLADTGQRADLCGVTVLGSRAAFTGAYTYLHRDVPLIYENQLCSTAPSNYIIAPVARASAVLPKSYQLAEARGDWALYRRDGTCQLSQAYDWLLEGAQDMGLTLPRAVQAGDHSLRFDLARNGGSFSRGWGHGELVECDPARWVTAKQAWVDFDFDPAGLPYQLTFRARAHEGATKQRFAIAVNGVRATVGPMSTRLTNYTVDIPDKALRNGSNRIELAFSQAMRASASDERELAAFFRSLEILPKSDDFVVDVALNESRRHLVRGFQAPEQAGDSTFVWSDGASSEVEGTLIWPDTPYLLETFAEAVPLMPPQRTRVFANNDFVGVLDIAHKWKRQRLAIPATMIRRGKNRIRFEYEAPVRPFSIDSTLADRRELAVRFRRIELSPLPATSELDFGTASARPYLLEGWSNDEHEAGRSAVWSDGEQASVLLSFDGVAKPVLRVSARGYRRALPLDVDVSVDGERVGSFAAPDGWQNVGIPLPDGDYSGASKIISLAFSRTARASDSNPESQDQRRLALRVDRIWVDSDEPGRSAQTVLSTLQAEAR